MIRTIASYLRNNVPLSPVSWLAGVSSIFFVRFFLEAFSSPVPEGFYAAHTSTILHYYFFFLAFSLAFILFVRAWIRGLSEVAPQFVSVSLLAIFIAPVVDWAASGGRGLRMTYLFDTPVDMLHSFLSFFGPDVYQGITIGIRVEVAVLLLAVAALVYLDSKNPLKAVAASASLYVLVFAFVSAPGVVALIAQAGLPPLTFLMDAVANAYTASDNLPTFEYGSTTTLLYVGFDLLMARIFALVSIVLGGLVLYVLSKEKTLAVVRNSRPERVAHWLFMLSIGFGYGYAVSSHAPFTHPTLSWVDGIFLAVVALGVYFSWMFAVCVNDLEDTAIDTVSNADRPLIRGALSQGDMRQAAHLFLLLTVSCGLLCGPNVCFFLLSFTALYYVYSAPPTRYKLVPFLSSFLIALGCLSVVAVGFFALAPVKDITLLPPHVVVGIIAIFFLWSHIRDMKDIEGDREAGVYTVPVLFGAVWGPRVVGLLSSAAYLLVPVFFAAPFFLAFPAAFLNYYVVIKKPYREWPVFTVYVVFVLALGAWEILK